MKTLNLAKIRREMEKTLEPKRYEHTLSVAYTAANLAAVHGADIEKALIAGMLHDCAKCLSYKKQKNLCLKYHFQLTQTEKDNKDYNPVLHAKAGAVLAKEKYGVKDEDILNAISYHTTGRPQMSLLEKIIYIADYIEPGRKHTKGTMERSEADELTKARQAAFRDLDEALVFILGNTLAYLKGRSYQIDPMTQVTYDYYSSRQKGRIE